MNDTDAEMGAVTETPGGDRRPWTVIMAAGLFWLLATGLAGAGVWGVTQVLTGDVESTSAAVGIAAIAWLVALYYWFIGRRLLQGDNIIAQAVFQALLWLPIGYYVREAGLDAYGLAVWALAGAMLALVLSPPTRRAVGFGQKQP